MVIDIKDKQGLTRISVPIQSGAKGVFSLMKEDYIQLPFSSETVIQFKMGDYADLVEFDYEGLGGKISKIYEIVDLPTPTYNYTTGGYDYQLRLDAYYWKWKHKIFKYTPENAGQEASWSLTAALDVHLGIVLRNLKALGYTYRGSDFTFSIDSTVENKAVSITYDNINILDALFTLASKDYCNCDCWVTDNVIHFGRNEFGDAVKFERDVEAASIGKADSKGTYATRIFAFGSTRNIPENYRPTEEQPVINGVVQKRLMLPLDTPFIDAYPDMYTEEAIEDVIVFDDIYPHRIGTMSDVNTVDRDIMDGQEVVGTFKAYQYKDLDLEFKEEYLIDTQELKIKFESGKLNGFEFSVHFNPNKSEPAEQLWEIVRNENYGRPLPDDILRPENGDKYVLSGFNIQLVSDLYIPEAEQELKERALKYVEITKKDDGIYPVTLFSDFVYKDQLKHNYEFGQKVNLVDKTYFENGRESRIIGWEVKLDIPWDSPIYTIGESMPYSRIGEIEDKIDALTYKGQTYTGGGGSGVYIITTNDSTAPSDSNVFSALRSLATFLRKDKVEVMNFLIKLLGGVVTDNIESTNLVLGPLGLGYVIKVDPETGRSYAEVDELYVRLKAYFDTLEIKHLSQVGGTIVISPASMECNRVEIINAEEGDPLYDSLNSRLKDVNSSNLFAKFLGRVTEKVYRCYFNNTDGTKDIVNEFAIDDLAQCRTFNVKEGVSENVSNQYYWRRVVAVGDNYIDLSATDCGPLSTEPQAGDTIVTIGNKTDARRQNVIMLMSFGEGSPAIYQYSGINSYSLEGKAKTIISPERNEFRGTFYFESGENIKEFITVEGEKIKTETSESILQILPDKITLEVSKQISTVIDDVDSLKTQVSSLEIKSDQISTQVVTINSTANTALNTANNAQTTANNAYNKANSAQSTAASAEDIANAAKELANNASNIGIYGQETYNQTNNPWSSWPSGTEYKHVGALWYNPNTDITQVYVGTTGSNTWETISTSNYATASFILQNSDKISAVVANFDINGKPTASSGIITEAYGNTLWASSALEDGNELVSIINQTSTTIKLSAQKISLNGVVTANGTFSIDTAGYMECTGGEIGGFTIKSNSISCDGRGSSLTIGVDGGRFFRVNANGSTGSMCAIRADSANALSLSTYGSSNNCIGLNIICNAAGYGYAIKSYGNVLLEARNSETVTIKGLVLNMRTVGSGTTLNANDDCIRFTNTSTITVTMPAPVPGKVIFMFPMYAGSKVTLKPAGAIGFRSQDHQTYTTYTNETVKPQIWICDGSYWDEFYCGN